MDVRINQHDYPIVILFSLVVAPNTDLLLLVYLNSSTFGC